MAQALFHAGKDCFVVTSLDVDDAIRDQTCLRERRSKKVRPGQAPKHFAPASRRHPGAEQCRCCPVNRAVAATSDLMECPQSEASTRQT